MKLAMEKPLIKEAQTTPPGEALRLRLKSRYWPVSCFRHSQPLTTSTWEILSQNLPSNLFQNSWSTETRKEELWTLRNGKGRSVKPIWREEQTGAERFYNYRVWGFASDHSQRPDLPRPCTHRHIRMYLCGCTQEDTEHTGGKGIERPEWFILLWGICEHFTKQILFKLVLDGAKRSCKVCLYILCLCDQRGRRKVRETLLRITT